MRQIRGKIALVTGAASGIGRAIALRLAREGADLHLLDLDEANLARVVAEAKDCGVRASGARCDLSRPEEITAANQAALAEWGTLDILVNNAGIAYYGPTVNMRADQWQRLLAVNLHAPIQFTCEWLPILLERPEAHVLNVASMYGLVTTPRTAAYHASKFGLVGFTESLRMEYGRLGLGVTALCPGMVRTNLFASAVSGHSGRDKIPEPPRWLSTTPERVAEKALRAIYRDQRQVLVTPFAHVLCFVKRFLPGLLDAAFRLDRWRSMRKKRLAMNVKQAA